MKFKFFSAAFLTLALVASAGVADAQSRGGRWEFGLGTFYQLGSSPDFENGTSIDTDAEFGFVADFGYNFTDNTTLSFGLQYAGIGYDATVPGEEDTEIGISGTYDTWAISSNLIYNFSPGPVTPYVGVGIGYTWVDTNIPDGPSQGVCWWDPWWGWICYETYPTKTESAFSYQALLGLRYAFSETTFMKLGYTSQWTAFSNSDGTPRFDQFVLEIGWIF